MSKRKTHKSTDTHQYLGGTVRKLFFCSGIWCFVCRFFIISVKMLKLLICNFKYELSELKLCRFTTVFYNTRPSTLILFWTTLVHRKKIKFWIWQIINGYKFWVLLLNTSLQMRTRDSQILNHMLINFVYMFIHDLYFVFITSCLICLNDNRVLFIYF